MTTADASPLGLAATGEVSEVVVAGYRVERLLRRHSAKDAVYVATEVQRERSVELRVLAGHGDPARRAGFAREVVQPASIVHPNLPAVYDSGEASQGMYLATARLEGVTLAELAGDDGLPPSLAVRLLGAIADALDAVHGQGLAHGDVRPENVVVVERRVEHPYLVDFALRGAENGDGALAVAADVRAFAATLSACLADGTPAALGELLTETMSGTGADAPRSAGELMREAARTLLAAPGPASEPAPAPVEVPRRRPVVPTGVRGLAALALVLAAGAAGYLFGRPSGGDGDAPSAASAAGVSVSLPRGWSVASSVPRIRGLDLGGAVAVAGPNGRRALVAGRLRGLRGSVYPAEVAHSVARRPPRPRPVSLRRYQALRLAGLDAPGIGRLTLFLVPTSGGTLAAACLPNAPAACERAAASIELSGAAASGVAEGERFARRLDRVLAGLDRDRSAPSRRLRSARLSPGQVGAGRELARAYRAARDSVVGIAAPPAARAAKSRLTASLSSIASAYARLARAAERREEATFAKARSTVGISEARLRSLLRGL